jgi:hypothetical protein
LDSGLRASGRSLINRTFPPVCTPYGGGISEFKGLFSTLHARVLKRGAHDRPGLLPVKEFVVTHFNAHLNQVKDGGGISVFVFVYCHGLL